jgi:hypothetical protein
MRSEWLSDSRADAKKVMSGDDPMDKAKGCTARDI